MAANTRSLTYNALLSTTIDKWRKKMIDNIFNSNPTTALLKEGGRVEIVDGGAQIVVPVMYELNTTVGSYAGYEVVDVAPQEGMTTAYYPWSQYAGAISIDGLTTAQNAGAARMIDLLKAKIKQTQMTFSEILNRHLWAVEGLTTATTGNGGKNIQSIPQFVQKVPAGTGNLDADMGGINQGDESWWRNQIKQGAATSGQTNFEEVMEGCLLAEKGTGGAPKHMIGDMYSWMVMNQYLQITNRQYTNISTADGGFQGLEFMGKKFFWDVHVPDMESEVDYTTASTYGTVFALHLEFLKLCMLKGKDFRTGKFIEPVDQDARTAKCIAYLQLVSDNRRKHAVIYKLKKSYS